MAVAGAGSVTASHRSARDRSASPTTASVPPSLDDESSDDVAEVGEMAGIAGGADGDTDDAAPRDEGPWRRQLIRAALPRPEGQQPAPTRPATEFTIRQPTNARGQNRRRGASGFAQAGNGNGPMRFGRGAPGQGQGPGQGGRRRRGRGGKKNH
jgi:hypothetical protein